MCIDKSRFVLVMFQTAGLLLHCLEDGGFFNDLPPLEQSEADYIARVSAKMVGDLAGALDNLTVKRTETTNDGDQLVFAEPKSDQGASQQTGLRSADDVKNYIGGKLLILLIFPRHSFKQQ